MKNTKCLIIIGFVLILCLSTNVSAMPYLSIGNITHNFTVVPNTTADITLPIMVKNVSAHPAHLIKGLQFNVTYNCSLINITNITHVDIVGLPRRELYNQLCNESGIPPGFLMAFCFFMNTTLTPDNKTNASILSATVRDLGNGSCILRIAFASYKNLTTDTVIGRVKMKVKPMPSYFATNVTSPLNITIERMGLNRTVYINVTNATIHSQAKRDGLIMACRGDPVIPYGVVTSGDAAATLRHIVGLENLTPKIDCIDLVSPYGVLTSADAAAILRHIVGLENLSVITH